MAPGSRRDRRELSVRGSERGGGPLRGIFHGSKERKRNRGKRKEEGKVVGHGKRRERERERGCDVRGHREGKKRKRWRRMG
jgi:hypothetical protein